MHGILLGFCVFSSNARQKKEFVHSDKISKLCNYSCKCPLLIKSQSLWNTNARRRKDPSLVKRGLRCVNAGFEVTSGCTQAQSPTGPINWQNDEIAPLADNR